MNVLIDINVPLDVLLAREPWLSEAREIWAAHGRRAIVGQVAAHARDGKNAATRRRLAAYRGPIRSGPGRPDAHLARLAESGRPRRTR